MTIKIIQDDHNMNPMNVQDSIDQQRAEEYLDELLMSPALSGESSSSSQESSEENVQAGSLSDVRNITRKRSEWALTKLYETDEGFKASVDELIPHAGQMFLSGTLGPVLADQLKGALGLGSDESSGASAEDRVEGTSR
jgi:hypothetical protein